MKKRRMGNDFDVAWSIVMENSEPFDFEGEDVSLYLSNAVQKIQVSEFSIEKNVIKWKFKGRDQKHPGIHSLTLVVNAGKDDMRTVDFCQFVELVDCSCKISGADDPGVSTDGIELRSVLDMGGKTYAHAISALNRTQREWKDKGIELLLGDLIIVTPEYGDSTILDAKAFQYIIDTYKLMERQGVFHACLYKENKNDKHFNLGNLHFIDTPSGSRMDISYISGPSKESLATDDSLLWRPDLSAVIKNRAFILSYGYLIPLGIGDMTIMQQDIDKGGSQRH